jgi:hypothetical protein
VTRWLVSAVAAMALCGALAVAARRLLGRRSRPSVLTPLIACWLGAYVLWTFAGGLLLRYGVLEVYDGPYYLVLALAGGFLQYRAAAGAGGEPGTAIFVGGQLLWLVVVLVRNGLFRTI